MIILNDKNKSETKCKIIHKFKKVYKYYSTFIFSIIDE